MTPLFRTSPRKRKILIGIGSLLVAVILTVGVFALGVYWWGWNGARTQQVLRYVPLPAGMVEGRRLSFLEYFEQRRALEQSSAYLEANTGGVYQPQPDQDAGATALTKMVRLIESERLMSSFGITITDAELVEAIQRQVVQQSDPTLVETSIKRLYGWTLSQYGQYVIRPALILNKLQEKLSFDETLNRSTKLQADQVLAKVKAGEESFQELAKKYSDDPYGASGGDLGFVAPGEQALEIDQAVAGLGEGETSNLIHTRFGYHIIKVIARKEEDGVEKAHLQQITILAPQVDAYVNSELKQRSVRIFVNGYYWDAATARVVNDATTNANSPTP